MIQKLLALICSAIALSSCTELPESAYQSTQSNSAPVAASLSFVSEPAPLVTSGILFSAQPVVEIEDSAGDLIQSAQNQVTLSVYLDSACQTPIPNATGSLSGTQKLAAQSGLINFQSISYAGQIVFLSQ